MQVPRRVKRAVELDRAMPVTNHPDLRHSSSSRDVTSTFFHIKDVWNQLGWSETLADQTSESVAPVRPHLAAIVKVTFQMTFNL